MKKLLLTIIVFLMSVSFTYGQTDVDIDDNNDIDVTYGGTNKSALNLITDELTGRIMVSADDDARTLSAEECSGYLILEDNDADPITLPELTGATTTGYNFCVLGTGTTSSNELRVTPNAADHIEKDGTTFTGTYATNLTGPDTKGDKACFIAINDTTWILWSYTGTWTDGG